MDERALVLLGQPSIQEFVRFVRTRATDGQQLDEVALTQEWRRANAVVRELEVTEREFADSGEIEPLPSDLAKVADESLQDPATQRSVGFLPHYWGMVELDRLIVWQKYVNVTFTDHVRRTIPINATARDTLKVAVGARHELPALRVSPLSSTSFAFSSPSTDVRVLGAVPLDPAKVSGYEPYGRAAAVLAVYIGFSVNVMWAVQMGRRLLLINGTHRAYALRAHGVTHAPCLISRIVQREDLELVGIPEQGESSSSYFGRERPPLLKDYFDARLYKTISMPRFDHIIQLDLDFDRIRTPTHVQ